MAWRIGHLCTHQIDQAKEETETMAWTLTVGGELCVSQSLVLLEFDMF